MRKRNHYGSEGVARMPSAGLRIYEDKVESNIKGVHLEIGVKRGMMFAVMYQGRAFGLTLLLVGTSETIAADAW